MKTWLLVFGLAIALAGCGDDGGGATTGDTGADDVAPGGAVTDDADEPGPVGIPPLTAADVDPFIGTGGHGWFAGNALIGASLPFGLIQASPDTTNPELHWFGDHCSGYHVTDGHLIAVSHGHLHGTGIPELGTIGLRPVAGTVVPDGESWFDAPLEIDKATEAAEPGYYAVTLSESGVRIELTVTERAAVHRYSVPEGVETLTIVVDAGHTIIPGVVDAVDVSVAGRVIDAYAHASNEFSKVDRGVEQWLSVQLDRDPVASGVSEDGRWAWMTVEVDDGVVEAEVGLSYSDAAHAVANREAEVWGVGFEAVRAAATAAWDEALGVLRCADIDAEERTALATHLYHAWLMPNLLSDADGTYRGFDDELRVDAETRHYTSLSLWDTYRTLHPLMALIAPEAQRDMVRSLIAMADQGGWLPKWPVAAGYSNVMIGAPADIVIAESYLKGINDFDVEAAWAHILKMADTPTPEDHVYEGRGGVEHYVELGYVPWDLAEESVSRTLEFAAADFAVANLAAALGHGEDAARFDVRARAYENVWDAETGYFRPRKADGSWVTPFDPLQVELAGNAFTEGNAGHYVWMVLHDVAGLAELMGGADVAVERLEAFLEGGAEEHVEATEGTANDQLFWVTWVPTQYWHGNEPDIHAAWLFALLGRPDLARHWVHWVRDNVYDTSPTGVPGNDDAGTLAAWYLFATLGFYPIAGSDQYVLGTPVHARCELDTPSGTLVVTSAAGEGGATSATVDGVPLDTFPIVHHDQLVGGRVLALE